MANNNLLSLVSDDVRNWIKDANHYVDVCCGCGNTFKKHSDATKIHEIEYCSNCEYISVCFYSESCPYNLMYIKIEKLSDTITNLFFYPTQSITTNVNVNIHDDYFVASKLYDLCYKRHYLYTVRELYSCVKSIINKEYDIRWSIPNYFKSLPNLSSVQKVLDKLNPNMSSGEIVIEI